MGLDLLCGVPRSFHTANAKVVGGGTFEGREERGHPSSIYTPLIEQGWCQGAF